MMARELTTAGPQEKLIKGSKDPWRTFLFHELLTVITLPLSTVLFAYANETVLLAITWQSEANYILAVYFWCP